MPKSKNRKAHKQKLKARRVRLEHQNNQMKKFYQMMQAQHHLQQENSKREHIIETIYNNRPEIAKLNDDGVLIINNDVLETKEKVLIWKDSGNPLLSGLEPLENYPLYTEELVNQFLSNIQHKQKLEKEQVENSGLKTEVVEDINAELGINDDFELVEDTDFIEDAEIIEEIENDNTEKS